MNNQRTSKPVSEGLAELLGRMVKDASRNYPGGTRKLELVKGDPDFISGLYRHFDQRAEERAQNLSVTTRPPWKKIQVGTHDSVDALQQAVIDAGNKIDYCGKDILKRITAATDPTEIELYQVTVAGLGFPDGAHWSQIRTKLDEYGFGSCPAEVGPQLRLQYTDQPMNEWLWIVMEPIKASNSFLQVFSVRCNSNGQWLCVYSGCPDFSLFGSSCVVFCRKENPCTEAPPTPRSSGLDTGIQWRRPRG